MRYPSPCHTDQFSRSVVPVTTDGPPNEFLSVSEESFVLTQKYIKRDTIYAPDVFKFRDGSFFLRENLLSPVETLFSDVLLLNITSWTVQVRVPTYAIKTTVSVTNLLFPFYIY